MGTRMTTTTTEGAQMSTKNLAARAALAAGLMWAAAFPALADNTLKDVRYAPGADGKVDITFEFAQPVGAVNAFTTDAPPRIAIDFPETSSDFEARRLAVGSGAASAVSVVEAGGRTRAVVDLFRAAGYTTRSDGNLLVLSLEGGASAAATASGLASPNPAKRIDSGIRVSAVDFRRGEDGSGRVIVRFNEEGAQASLRQDGNRIFVTIDNAQLPADQKRRLDVTDFATPVTKLEPTSRDGGTQLVVSTEGLFETSAYQTGNEYILEVTPKGRPAANAAVGQAGAAPQAARYTGRPVTFNFQDVPVRTILQLIAEESGLNIVAADTVTGNLTLRLINVPWDQALDVVLRARSLDKRRDGNVVWVAPQAEIAAFEQAKEQARIELANRSALVSEMIAINYANAEEIATLLTEGAKSGQGGGAGGANQEQGFLSPRGSVSFDTRSNTLLVSDTAEKVQEIKELVAVLDRPVDQVLIEARIVIANESFARDLGARFGLSGQEGDVITSGSIESNRTYLNTVADNNALLARFQQQLADFNAGLTTTRPTPPTLAQPGFDNIINSALSASAGAGATAFTILGNNLNLDIELQALQEEGRGEVVANPRVITANQREAIIKQGDEIGFLTVTGAGANAQAQVQFKEVVLELKVTPTITQDDRVFLNLAVKKDEVADFIPVPGGGGSVPRITKREVTTAVLVNNGQTVVVGGIYEFTRREDLAKIPFLGDIPGIGNLFRNKGRNNTKAELLVFMTPRILEVAGAQR